MRTRLMIAMGALALALGLTACGDDADSTTAADEAAASSEMLTGAFEAVPDAPKGSDGIGGIAELTVGEDGTDVSIELTGLEPDTAYASHLHAGACDQPDPGGPHFKFDLNGEEMPPNEIHLPFTTDADGNGSAEASNDQAVPDPDTRSVVIHLADDSEHGSEHSGEKGDEENSGDEGHTGDEKSEHGADDGHSGHTHQPKIACADLS